MQIAVRVHAVPKGGRRYSGTQTEDAFHHTDVGVLPFIAAVADGHGDPEVNGSTRELATLVAQMLCDKRVVALDALCELIDETVKDRFLAAKNGAVATRVLFDSGGLQVMWVGDVRLYQLLTSGSKEFEQLTEDHHPDHPKEFARLALVAYHPEKNPNGTVILMPIGSDKPQRIVVSSLVNGKSFMRSLAVSRSFGDPDIGPIVISEPDVRTIPFETSVRSVFALCSDGGAEIVEKTFIAARQKNLVSLDQLVELSRLLTPESPRDDVMILFIECTPKKP